MAENTLVIKREEPVAPTSYAPAEFKKPGPGERFTFELNVVAEQGDKMHKWATVQPNCPTWGNFEIHCDEGLALGGEDLAPSPLSYFSVGIAFCLLTHFTQFINARKLKIDRIRLEERMLFATSTPVDPEGEHGHFGVCDGIELHVLVDSPEPEEKVRDLIETAQKTCMALQTAIKAVPKDVHMHLKLLARAQAGIAT